MLRLGLKIALTVTFATFTLFAQETGDHGELNQYSKIAAAFVKQSAKTLFPGWKETNVTKITPFYSSNNHLLAYEATLAKSYDMNRSQGYLFVNAQKDKSLINTFSAKGRSISDILLTFWNEKYAPLCKKEGLEIEDFKFLIALPSAYAIGVKIIGDADFLTNVPQQNGYYIFTPFPASQYVDYRLHAKRVSRGLKPSQPALSSADAHERDLLKKALLDEDFTNIMFKIEEMGEIKHKKQTRDLQSIRATFAPFYQEYRYWNNDDMASYAGCIPVAWAILYEYWDERGYAKLVGPASMNSHYDVTDHSVRYVISRIRDLIDINIDPETKQAGTNVYQVAKAINYAYERGYSNFSAFTTNDTKGWPLMKSAINDNQPSLVTFPYGSNTSHEAVVYKYVDSYGYSNDYICVRTGWRSQPDQCLNRSAISAFTIVKARETETGDERPSNDEIKYGAVAYSTDNPTIVTLGATWNTTSEAYAREKALQSCRNQIATGCKMLKVIENSCIAIAQIPYVAKGSYATATNIDDAQSKARAYCNKLTENEECFIRLAFCSDRKGYIAHLNPVRREQHTTPSTEQQPSQQQQTNPSSDSRDKFAAIAIAVRDGKLIRWGRSWNMPSLDSAKSVALESCANSLCRVITYAKNECVSLAKIRYQNRGNYHRASTYGAAREGALRACRNRNQGECISVATVCARGQ